MPWTRWRTRISGVMPLLLIWRMFSLRRAGDIESTIEICDVSQLPERTYAEQLNTPSISPPPQPRTEVETRSQPDDRHGFSFQRIATYPGILADVRPFER